MAKNDGFTFIELLITVFIVGTVITGIFGLFVLSLQTAHQSESRVVAIALANEKAEMIRNLPYAAVGTAGGIPSGSIPATEVVTRNGAQYTVKTDIRYIDDPYDGLLQSQPPDPVNTDYKRARIEVSWPGPQQAAPILVVTDIAPAGVEGGDQGGTFDLSVLDAQGAPVPQTQIQIVNSQVNPAINLQTQVDNQGHLLLPGLPPSNATYKITVSQPGYTTEQTMDTTSTFIPDVDHTHLSALQGRITSKAFIIDHVSSLTIATQDESGQPVPNIPFNLKGTKTLGTNNTNQLVYRVNQNLNTGGTSQTTINDLIWDTYNITIDGVATGYDIKEVSVPLPAPIVPNTTTTLTVVLVPHTDHSLQVTVTSPTNQPIDNATVHLLGPGTDVTKGTGVVGQVFFSDLPSDGDYQLTIQAPNYEDVTQTVTITGTTRFQSALTPLTP